MTLSHLFLYIIGVFASYFSIRYVHKSKQLTMWTKADAIVFGALSLVSWFGVIAAIAMWAIITVVDKYGEEPA